MVESGLQGLACCRVRRQQLLRESIDGAGVERHVARLRFTRLAVLLVKYARHTVGNVTSLLSHLGTLCIVQSPW